MEMAFDWPRYSETDVNQFIVAQDEILSRGNAILSQFWNGVRVSKSIEQIKCGYYDPGAKKRIKEHKIQMACSVTGGLENSNEQFGIFVPAASIPLNDLSWKELSVLK